MGGVAVEFFPCFEFGIFFVDVGVCVLFAEEVAEGGEKSEEVSFVDVFDVLYLNGMGGLGGGGIMAVQELVELWNEAVGTCLENVIIESAEVEEFFCFVAKV